MAFPTPDKRRAQNKRIMCLPCSGSVRLEVLKNPNCPYLQKQHKSHLNSDLVLLKEQFSDQVAKLLSFTSLSASFSLTISLPQGNL